MDFMIPTDRRRQDVGEAASAALPLLWDVLQRRNWSHADFARELSEDAGKVAKLLYGDRKPGRQLSLKLLERFEISLALWDLPLPRGWAPWKNAA